MGFNSAFEGLKCPLSKNENQNETGTKFSTVVSNVFAFFTDTKPYILVNILTTESATITT